METCCNIVFVFVSPSPPLLPLLSPNRRHLSPTTFVPRTSAAHQNPSYRPFPEPDFPGGHPTPAGGVFVSRPVYPSLAALRSWGLLRTLPATPPNRPRQNLEIGTGSGKCQNILWTTPLVKMLSTKFPQTSPPQTIAMLRPRAGIPINI